MEWIAGLAAFSLIIWLMVKSKAFRYTVLGMVALMGAGGWAWYEKNQSDERRAYALIKPSELEIRDARLSTGSLGKMTATIKNNSLYQLSSITVIVTVFDCPKGQTAINPQCETIGEASGWFSSSIPAGQVRAVDSFVSLTNLPPLRGEMQWYYRIDRVRAEPR